MRLFGLNGIVVLQVAYVTHGKRDARVSVVPSDSGNLEAEDSCHGRAVAELGAAAYTH